MKIFKNKTNILLFFAMITFIITCTLHIFNEEKVASAQGSVGGRIITAIKTLEPPAVGPCTGAPCACSVTITTNIQSAGGVCPIICPPIANVPNTGSPISPSSAGSQILGFYTVCMPTAASSNFGTDK